MKKVKLEKIFRILFIAIGLFLLNNTINAQEDSTAVVSEEPQEDEGMLPVRNPWATGMLIDNQTTETPNAGSLEFAIHHRFGKMLDLGDLYGIYAASNIRLGITYGITEKIAIGFGTEKNNKMQEFTGKYKILSQSRNGKIPVSVTYFGNIVIDARDEEFFGTSYEFKNRLSFFNQIIVSRKLTEAFSVQLAGSYSHFNAVTELVQNEKGQSIGKWKNDYIGVMGGARYKFHNNMSAIAEYCQPFAIDAAWQGQSEPKPSIGVGLEIGTSTIFASNYQSIIAQENYSHNLNDYSFEGWLLGFNITVRF